MFFLLVFTTFAAISKQILNVMPHIDIKCYPKHLTENEMKAFITELTQVAGKHLKSGDEYISISYKEIPAEQWKDEVFDKEIRPNIGKLAKDPGYHM